jgi:hypothetical protein
MLVCEKNRPSFLDAARPGMNEESLDWRSTMSPKPFVVATLAVLLTLGALAHAQDTGPYKVLKIQLVGGDGGFDYVTADPDGRNLYVARSGPAGHIGVYNLDTLAPVGDIPGVSAHGGAVDTSTGHGFATSKPVAMFDAKTFAILKKIDVQGNPDGYLNDAYNHHFYILSHAEPNITVLDDKDGSILGTINIGGAPEQAVTDGHGKIYVDIEDKDAIAVIDANSMKMVGKYDVSSKGGGCAGLALRRLSRQKEHDHSVGHRWAYHHRSAHRQWVGWSHIQPSHDGGIQLAGRWHADGGEGRFSDQLLGRGDGIDASAREGVDAGPEDKPDLYNHGRIWSCPCRTTGAGCSARCISSPSAADCRWRSAFRTSGMDERASRSDDSRVVPDTRDW